MSKIFSFFEDHIMLVACLFLAGTFVFGTFSVASFSTLDLIFLRFFIAAVCVFVLIRIKSLSIALPKELYLRLFALSLVGITIYHWLLFKAIASSTALNNSLLSATVPIITLILSVLFFGERMNLRSLTGMLMSFCGVGIIISGGSIHNILNISFNSGDLFMLSGVLLLSIYFNMLKSVLNRMNPLVVAFYLFFFSVVVLLPFVAQGPLSRFQGLPSAAWYSLFYMGIFASVFALVIQQFSIKRIGPAKTALYLNLIPVFSLLLSLLFLDETVHLHYLISLVIILSGVYITLSAKSKTPAPHSAS
ncbi:DMT family transporter [Desulfobaculum bizertense]|uniref:EamA-like transporter family protein n=1 Tax=Desulfobaculum bizertense DSM 18034 TaxID=1121442 RepID=A0A1T4VXE6_9BACT|nr:DMT family transporter [Desulfobaculum bizertense]SKA69607.1 EamA-like transporter family protein [Desulfobaculum bizertense DSM 18034]